MVLVNLSFFIFFGLLLIISGIFLVKSLSKIARLLGISEFSAAFFIMAFASSVPELFVGISSAFAGNPGLSLGNILGANILDLTLVSGIIIFSAKKIKIKSKRIGSDAYLMILGVILVIVLFLIGQELSRIDGAILLGFFLINFYNIFKQRKNSQDRSMSGNDKFYWVLIFVLSLFVLFVASYFVVEYASDLAIELGFSEIILGLFLISIATTLPELVFGLSATGLEHKMMAIGDQFGSVFINSTLILGVVALIHPIKVEFTPFLISAIFMFISAYVFVNFIKRGGDLGRKEGVALVLIYVVFVIIQSLVN